MTDHTSIQARLGRPYGTAASRSNAMSRRRLGLAVLVVTFVSGCSGQVAPADAAAPAALAGAGSSGTNTTTASGTNTTSASGTGTTSASGTGTTSASGTGSTYVIGPGDVLSIFVYEAPPLSVQELPVRPDGRISVPLVPDVVAAGRTPTQLGADIAEKLKKFVQDPNVTVMVRNFQGPLDRQVRVIGEATDPQAIPFRENMSLLDVMIATKGLTKFAAGNRAVIVRHDGGTEQRIHVRLSDLIKDGDTRQNVTMHPGDTLIIPQSFF